jgi:multiple sugar transport system permease protein
MKEMAITVWKYKFWYVLNIALSLFFLSPILWALSTSLKPTGDITKFPPRWIPETFSWEHYKTIWEYNQHIFSTYFLNSVTLTVFTVLLNVLISASAAYGLSKLDIPFKKIVLVLILATMMVPFQSLLIPLYTTMKDFGLLNTRIALIIIYITFHLPVAVYIMINSFDAIPGSLREAAQLDGARETQIFFRMMLPLVWPGLATVTIYTAYTTWNDYIIALVFTSGDAMRTINVGLTNMALGIYGTDWGLLTSGSTISFLPMILLFAFLQRYFINGLTSGSVK